MLFSSLEEVTTGDGGNGNGNGNGRLGQSWPLLAQRSTGRSLDATRLTVLSVSPDKQLPTTGTGTGTPTSLATLCQQAQAAQATQPTQGSGTPETTATSVHEQHFHFAVPMTVREYESNFFYLKRISLIFYF